MVAAVLSVVLVTASFALVASDASFGVTAPLHVPEEASNCGIPDCNGNGEDDHCDLDCSASGEFCVDGATANDLCYAGHFPSCGTSEDCNDNDVPDECEGPDFCCVDSDCPRFHCCGQITANQCNFCIE